MLQFLLVWVVTTVSLLILSRLPLGVEIDDFSTALVAALVLGLLNATLRPILLFLTFPLTIFTLGLFTFVINAVVLMAAAGLVSGFKLRGCLSAFVASLVLGLLNAILLAIFTS